MLDNRGIVVRFPAKARDFYRFQSVQIGCVPPMGTGALSHGWWLEADHLPHLVLRLRMSEVIPLARPVFLHAFHRDNFTIALSATKRDEIKTE